MNTNKLWEAIGKIDDKLLIDAIEVKRKEKCNTHRWWIGVAAAILIVIVSFSTAFTVSAKFREWVISLFQVKETELVPDAENYDKVSLPYRPQK